MNNEMSLKEKATVNLFLIYEIICLISNTVDFVAYTILVLFQNNIFDYSY